ncbi:MAG: hypothetical protein ACRDJH_26460 [Thermomicrobiales bacterium]
MVTKRQPHTEPTYEEQVAIARANLDRHIAEARAAREQLLAQGIDPEAEWIRFVRETFDRESLIETYRAYLANPHDWLEQDIDAEDE